MLFTSSVSVNATNPGWTNPHGDGGQPLLQIFVYGVTLPTGTPAIGDQIAVFNGGTLAGLLTLTKVPSLNDWTDCLLIAYSYNEDGVPLYTPGQAFMLSYFDVSADAVYNAWTWGDGMDIDFHNEWYAPTSDIEATATTYGAYFPAEGAYSYCYTNLTFVNTSIPTEATVDIHVQYYNTSDVLTNVLQATVSSGGYVATNNNNGTYTLNLFAGEAGSTQPYDYTVTVAHATLTNETFDITVKADPGSYNQDVYLNTTNDLSGVVTGNVLGNPVQPLEGALVTVTIDGTEYKDNTDATGAYLIENIPDGTWGFTYSYPGYISQTNEQIISFIPNTPTENKDYTLDIVRGYITGEIFDATTIDLIIDEVVFELLHADGTSFVPPITTPYTGGSYSNFGYYAGVYDIKVSSIGYDDFIVEDHTFYPEYTEELNFNLLPINTDPNWDPVTGDPNSLWSIHIEMAKFGANSLLPYDEIAIYDLGIDPDPGTPGDDVLVGTLRLENIADWQHSATNVLKAFGTLTTGPGFVAGHRMQFRAWDISHQHQYDVPLNFFFNEGVGTYHDTLFPDVSVITNPVSYLNIYWPTVPGELSGTVSDNNGTVDGVLVEILNRYTNVVIGTPQTTDGSGDYTFWPIDPGTYNVRFTKTGYDTYLAQDVVVTQNEVKTLNVTLGARTLVTMTYDYPSQGFYFIGRSIEKSANDMLDLLSNTTFTYNFKDNYFSSWVEDDAGLNLHYSGGVWTPQPYVWELLKGYQILINYAPVAPPSYTFDMEGYLVKPENNPISLPVGFSYVPYFPYEYQVDPADYDDAMTAFAGIFEDLDWVMDSDGNRLHHDNGAWVDNIGTLSPTEGYKVKMHDAATLTYPAVATKSTTNRSVRMDPEHFIFTGGNAATWTYTIYIETDDFEIGDEIAAFSNGVLVGSMVIDSEDPWQNDLNTFNEGVEGGYAVGSPIELRAWDVSENIDYSVGFAMVNVNDACYTGVNYPGGLLQFSYAHVTRGIVRVDENQINNSVRVYPNPVKSILNIESVNTINQIHMYNVYGALISNIPVNTQHQQMDVNSLIPGTYFIQLTTNNGIITKRVIIQ